MNAPMNQSQSKLKLVYQEIGNFKKEIEKRLANRVAGVKIRFSKRVMARTPARFMGGLVLGALILTATIAPIVLTRISEGEVAGTGLTGHTRSSETVSRVDPASVEAGRPTTLAGLEAYPAHIDDYTWEFIQQNRTANPGSVSLSNPSSAQGRAATLPSLEAYPAHIDDYTWEFILQNRTANPVLAAEYETPFFNESNFSNR